MTRKLLSKLNGHQPPAPYPEGDGGKIIACWRSPSNIALVKYWGKKAGQLPLNPSISMTLEETSTITRVEAEFAGEAGGGIVSINGDDRHPFLPKMENLLNWLVQEIPSLENTRLQVETSNNFPHSAGIASSASGMSAFALCLLSIAEEASGKKMELMDFFKMASFVSRRGSGSACRSVFGGFTVWGKTPAVPGSSDLFAIPVTDRVHPSLRTLHDTVLVVSSVPKSLSSSGGHALMQSHPYTRSRIRQAGDNLSELLNALSVGDLNHLSKITENEALTLHALIMSSTGGVILMEPQTVQMIKQIRAARQKGLAVFFTLDAGPNVHLLYPESSVPEVEAFIREELIPLCENGSRINDHCGTGPVLCTAEPQ
jgi:diphosphomevalonate decarboxylase